MSHKEYNAETGDPFAAINRLLESSNSDDESLKTFSTIDECYDEKISVEQEFEEILRFNDKFDVSFIISTSDNRVREILKEKFSFDIEMDCDNNLIIDSNGIKKNKITPYAKSSAEAIGKFLCSNWVGFQTMLDFANVKL